jgi:hypothetical protein
MTVMDPPLAGAALLVPPAPAVLPLPLAAEGMVDPPLQAANPSASPTTGAPIKARLSRFT